jgi:predicted dehydrogenase
MRQLIQSYRTGEMKLEDVPPPAVRPGGVVVRTVRSLVSAGTEKMIVDLARKSLLAKARARPDLVRKVIDTARKQGLRNAFQKVQSKLETPIPLGYSSAGVVVEVGEQVHEYRVGDRVVCAGAGYANHADYAYVPRNLLARLPDAVSMEEGCFATVGAIALQGVRQVQPTLGERVAVLGLGLIGQIAVQLLAANGCRVLGFDPNPDRAKLALELGASAAVSADLETAAERFTRGDGVDAVLIAASTPSAGPIEQAGEISRLRGRVVVVGLVGMEVPRSLYYRKELDLRMSMSYGPGRYDPDFEERGFDYPIAHVRWTEQRNLEAIVELLADRRLRLAPLVTHRFSVDEALAAYDLITKGSAPYLGVVLGYGADDEAAVVPPRRLALASTPEAGGAAVAAAGYPVRLGVVGAGGFGQSTLLPALRATGRIAAIAIASAGGATARRVGEQYGFRTATTDPAEVLAHPDVDAVVILTRHDLHAPLVVRALEAGKHVFVEKPLALSYEELEAVERAQATAGRSVMVGFNRRFAPLVEKLAAHFAGRAAPLVMHYRVNAGFLPSDHWVHDPVEGGGRLLGEGCHFVDLLHSLAGARPTRVFAECIGGGSRYRGDDNVAVTLRFADGSIGTLTYTALGDPSLGKESLEVYGEGGQAILDDFRTLLLARGRKTERMRAANQDKGFGLEMRRWVAAVADGGPPPIPFEELAATTRATLAAAESLRTGAPVDL